MLDLHYPLEGLQGAAYNPRHIDPDVLAKLIESIRTLGLVKPLIVRGKLLVAGHQRTKALRAMGVTHAPVYVLPRDTTTMDEVRFNQLHNGTDMDAGDEAARFVGGFEALGFQQVAPARLSANKKGRLAYVRQEIADMILRYGPWGGCVATTSGEVLHCAQYAIACSLVGKPITVCVVPDERAEEYRAFLSQQYGVFSYRHLKKDTYIQTLAQMFRLRENDEGGLSNKSTLYEGFVIPYLGDNRRLRVLDFGSGQGDYAAALRRRGFACVDVELFRRKRDALALDVAAIHAMIDKLCAELARNGRFDVVVCDSVMNSVDCLEAESAVVTLLNAFLKPGGRLFYSGRKTEALDRLLKTETVKTSNHKRRRIEFLDADGFSGIYRQGRWFYQKYHDAAQTEELTRRMGFEVVKHNRSLSDTWQVVATKARELPAAQVESAIAYEFDLPLGESQRIGRVADVKTALMPHIPQEP